MKSCKNDLRAAYIPRTCLPALQTLFQLILTKIQKEKYSLHFTEETEVILCLSSMDKLCLTLKLQHLTHARMPLVLQLLEYSDLVYYFYGKVCPGPENPTSSQESTVCFYPFYLIIIMGLLDSYQKNLVKLKEKVITPTILLMLVHF